MSFALLAPGYLLAYRVNIRGFRDRGISEQLAWSMVLSFAVGTLSTVAAAWLTGMAGAACLLLFFGVAWIFVVHRVGVLRGRRWRSSLPYAALALVLSLLAIFSLVDVGIHDRLHMSVTAYDNALRTAFVESVLRTGVPPANPVYWPGHDAPMRYYYFWYVVCAAVAKLGHISARQALIASSAWSMFGVAAALALFCRYVLEWRGAELRRRWWIAVALMSVTGLDGLIALIVFLGSGIVARDIEWWSFDQVSSWADTFLWAPHHAAALVCAVLCLVLMQLATDGRSQNRSRVLPVLAGVSFASAFGLSTYVAVGCGLVFGMWFLVRMLQGGRSPAFKAYALLCLTAGISLAPYLAQLMKPQPGARVSAGGILQFGVRELLPPVVLASVPFIRDLSVAHPRVANELSAGLLLFPSYFLELGFFAVALIFVQRLKVKNPANRTLLFLTWAALLSVSVLRSRVIKMNDYSVRASLIAQFCLIPIGVLALEKSRELTRFFLIALLVIGVAGSAYQVILLRTYIPIHDREGVTEYAGLAHQNFVLRDGYTEMQQKVPLHARVQFSIPNASYTGLAHQLNIGRQMIVDSEHCNDSFGGENAPCAAIQAAMMKLFGGAESISGSEAARLCASVGAEYLAVADWDAAWKQPRGWAWNLPAVVQRPQMRVVACSSKAAAR